MIKQVRRFKELGEKLFNLRIYRNLPHGSDVFYDIRKYFPDYRMETIFDVGANIGQAALLLAKAFPKSQISSFEPVSNTFKQLEQRVQNYKNISCFPFALGGQKSSQQIFLYPLSVENSLIEQQNQNFLGTETVEINTLGTVANPKQ
ncbi:MAG: FkbM family methyltransferase [Cyanobacteria bacterium J083]|nr:MAG: FkbM family methyltransferase [Cyanobacteria bacterium J083]